ncbi:2-C-methyl-D-erythritol 4-phosphate cytidylyltransferase [Desulfuribacillus stibiiarsenatis]|uniref:2-C-methyl-D-erythritol 4-phosphate cytidylyltransferase n=1 Tax=Desulfuribacillus stibiiarsenatis TaxID=1390249 RepID=A0A1E5L817_9FIRM|nr:2-C-methyl-D-erythritol 4-phosphate cytidylyltransferase [Desulfuribacillus stibiiarsenatis]OEH86302.1 2-C-methyl-D-erythritol 4-phosphate cytidylyltransferase [Desulfuribacillus stibiiarsenatis]
MTISAIIPAAGVGKRLGVGYNKQYVPLLDKPMVVYTIEAISLHPKVLEVIFVVGKDELEYAQELVDTYQLSKVRHVIAGGAERIYSVINGLKIVDEKCEYVLIHDGARPLITQEIIEECIGKSIEVGAAIVGVPVKDTIKIVKNQYIETTPSREHLWAAQTPQIIKKSWYLEAIDKIEDPLSITDDAMIMERMDRPVAVVKGSYENIKVTTPEDVGFAEMILRRRMQQ